MLKNRYSVVPLMLALAIGIASMPTHIFQICSRNIGTLEVEPWRQKSSGSLRSRVASLAAQIRAFLRGEMGRQAALVAASLVVALVLAAHPHAADGGVQFGVMGVLAGSNLKVLRQREADIRAELQALNDAVVAENRPMTDTEKTKLTDIRARQAATKEQLVIAEELNEASRVETPAAPNGDTTASAAASQVIVGRDNSEADPKRGFKDHKDFLAAVMDAGRTGRVNTRLKPLQATQGSDEAGTYSDPHGGFLVPAGVAPGILMTDAEADFIAPLVTNISPMSAPTVSFNARVDKDHTNSVSGGFSVTRRPETVDGSASRTKFEQVTLTANEEFGLAFATERILTDSPQSFVAIIAAGFNDEFANNAISERLNGSGVGERLGILHANNGALVTVNKETNQPNDTIVKENIDKMASRCWRYGQAIWLANNDARPQLRSLSQAVGTGGAPVPYFTESGGQEKLDGRPIYFTEHAKKLGDAGDLILAVWSQYLEGEYQQLQSAESIHVRFAAAERAFRFYKRNDGRPWWTSPLTPKNGAPTLSPFVILQAR